MLTAVDTMLLSVDMHSKLLFVLMSEVIKQYEYIMVILMPW